MVLLHGENTVDSAIWSFVYVYIPFTILTVSSTSTVSIGSPVHIDLNVKLQTGLISLAVFLKCIYFLILIYLISPLFLGFLESM